MSRLPAHLPGQLLHRVPCLQDPVHVRRLRAAAAGDPTLAGTIDELGASSLVIVGQGTVDAALSLRPEERRQLFEEAAGVKNLQVRKNEALGRLSREGSNSASAGSLSRASAMRWIIP